MNNGQAASDECPQDRLDRRDADLKIDAAPKRRQQWRRNPIPISATLLQHDLRTVAVEIGKAFFYPIEGHCEAAQVAPEPQALGQIGDQQLRD